MQNDARISSWKRISKQKMWNVSKQKRIKNCKEKSTISNIYILYSWNMPQKKNDKVNIFLGTSDSLAAPDQIQKLIKMNAPPGWGLLASTIKHSIVKGCFFRISEGLAQWNHWNNYITLHIAHNTYSTYSRLSHACPQSQFLSRFRWGNTLLRWNTPLMPLGLSAPVHITLECGWSENVPNPAISPWENPWGF